MSTFHSISAMKTHETQQSQVFKIDNIKLLPNYIPHPDNAIEELIEALSNKIQIKHQDLREIEHPPYISQLYGAYRKENYQELKRVIKGFTIFKRNQYKREYFKKVDRRFQESFEGLTAPIRQKYQSFILENAFNITLNPDKDDVTLFDSEDTIVRQLKSSILESSVDWYLLVDQAVDLLIRCQLYEIRGESFLEDIYSKIIKKLSKKQIQSGRKGLSLDFKLPIDYIKSLFERPSCADYEVYTQTIGYDDLFMAMSFVAYGELLSNSLKEVAMSNSKEFLVAMKGFLLVLVKTFDSVIQQLYVQIDKYLGAGTRQELEREEKNLCDNIDQLINLQDNMFFFNAEFVKMTFPKLM